ncbi:MULTISPECIES: LL-diaminopimelate aminotransferase [Archaeoglobus]|jgi:LL-diaminopimelate aminotransferase|uniref:Aminotransferase n=3 Tax=Archaeoglobus fulgidus TaxID=2234 RepID=O29838_ARCFU|nr:MULTISPECIES: LL-diaminopimelate aminotransferase [Archaeoglobus]AAB90825.1 aspartate aminotransferase (aspB-4) [Archaeoglobus fulgidus DSM 4304]AIG97228.1 LL-diaminopimelate aminotransferase [Archaeoglobus fulgidus DSM 8774]KUJ94384.1 MAG: Aspartate aminotransferase (AspB-4) [Archaeoglobus fulgidus]KUK06541.1 MAG: Aspartate aminotransferase (AspB-4) [Archaeoglobus fulgidus]MDI3497268.1 LL-diaminopimelate aminotransferase [Archaeoglobus sp.]
MFKLADRLEKIPPYLFAEIDAMKRKKLQEGVKVIDFGVGDPDLPTPEHIVEALKNAAEKVERQKYPSYEGMLSFRESVARFYRRRKGVNLDPESEVISLIGSKEGIAHLPLAFVNDGDYVLVPEPGYPVYYSSTLLADGVPYEMPLKEENKFLPDFQLIPDEIARKAKIMFLNYPNNPTAAVAPKEFIKEAIDFCIDNKIILAHDAAYSEITFDGYKAPSFLEFEDAFEVCVEFNSLSKTYNMTGWRIGFACGNRDILAGLLKVKTNVDSGVFEAIQEAAIAAMDGPDRVIEENCKVYQRRRDLLVEGLRDVGIDAEKPKATFYVWAKVGGSSIEFVKQLIDKAGIVATPGIGFGKSGEGFVRFALTRGEGVIEEAIDRLKTILHK